MHNGKKNCYLNAKPNSSSKVSKGGKKTGKASSKSSKSKRKYGY